MNYYFLLEDEKSFIKVLPAWLEYMKFNCTRVPDISCIKRNNYILQSGHGVTQLITKVLFDTIDTILNNPNKIDKLIVMLDTESLSQTERIDQVLHHINQHYGTKQFDFEIIILVCDHCFETWLLGKPGLYPTDVEKDSYFYPYYIHYDIENNDPEKMSVPTNCNDTIGKYHFHYLHEVLRYNRIRYSKSRPDYVKNKSFFNDLCTRANTTGHIKTFKAFIDFILSEK